MPVHPKIDDETGLAYGPWEEGWKNVVGYEDLYEVNHLSQVRNKKTARILIPSKRYQLKLSDGKNHTCNRFTYQLTLEAYFPHIPRNKRTADHINEIHEDHHVSNLW